MEERNNDTLHIDLMDYIKEYKPEIEVSKYKIEKFLEDFDIMEEGDTSIIGNKNDWTSFMVMIIEHYNF